MALDTYFVSARNDEARQGFWLRLGENFFRRAWVFLLPILVLGLLGVVRAGRVAAEYEAGATLSVSTNPLVSDSEVRGITIYQWETPGVGTARIISEQLSTDAFVETVARKAGLGDALDGKFLTLDDIRLSVIPASAGDTLVSITATWGDAQTAYALVNATINTYVTFVLDTEISDSEAAITFYTKRVEDGQLAVTTAQNALDNYLRANPEPEGDQERPIEEQLAIQRLSNALDEAENDVDDAKALIDEAQLAIEKATSEAGRRVSVVDAPRLPTEPKSTLIPSIVTVFTFLILGTVIAAAALVTTTLFDRSVRSVLDIRANTGATVVATVPVVKSLKRRGATAPASLRAGA
jgi:uncharacterized protein involved in exopolysaccharide biosynthesis